MLRRATPQFGHLLTDRARLVGLVLTCLSTVMYGTRASVRCNPVKLVCCQAGVCFPSFAAMEQC